MVAVTHIGTLNENYVWAAFAPDGQTLYVFENNRGGDIYAYTYPGLVEIGIAIPDDTGVGPIATDGDGELYWTRTDIAGSTTATQILKDPSSPTTLWTSSYEMFDTPVTLCWAPFDDRIYFLVQSVDVGEAGLWVMDKDGSNLELLDGAALFDTAVNTPVPTLDGAIWWSKPNPSATARVYRHDVAGASTAEVAVRALDGVIPQPDNTVLAYVSATGGRRIDAAMTVTAEPAMDALTPGQRGIAYVPDLSLCTMERRVTGEVWQIRRGRWALGKTI